MTYQEKVDSKKDKRSQSINQKTTLEINKQTLIDEDNFNNKYLWGDTDNIGIQDLIKYYYQEKNAEVGRTWSMPSLSSYTESGWESILESAITKSGDGDIYPDSDGDGVADEEIDTENSQYLNDNGDNGETSNGLKNRYSILENRIGQNASTTGTYTGPGGFGTESEAQTVAEEYLYGSDSTENTSDDNIDRIGITLRGRRTRDVEITITSTGTDPVVYNYEIGDGNIDEPNFYADNTDENGYGGSERTNFENALSNLISDLEIYRDNILIPLRDELDKIFDGTNSLFEDMKSDLTDDSGNIDTLITNLNGYIGSSGDTATNGTLYGYQDYFTGLADGSDSNFDTYLTELETLNNDIDTEISNRTSDLLNTYVGDTYENKMKKWRLFWIKERIAKPQSSLLALDGMDKAISNANSGISNANETLTTLYGNSDSHREEWIKTPQVFSAFYNPILNQDNGDLIQRRVGLAYGGQQHATEYEIFRDLYENITLDNDTQWSDTLKIADYTDLSDNGTIKLTYLDKDIESGKEYVYRVRVYDDSNDPNYPYSASLQSKIYDDENPVSYSYQTDEDIGSKLTTNKDNDLATGSVILLFSSSGDNDGRYTVSKVQEQESDKEFWISPVLTTKEDGNLYKFSCFVSVP